MALLPLGAWAQGWTFDFFNYCTTDGDGRIPEGQYQAGTAADCQPYATTSATTFTANGLTLYNLTTPNVNTNFGIARASGNAVFRLSNYNGSDRIGFMGIGTDKAFFGFQNLTKGQRIIIVASGEPTIQTGGSGSIVEKVTSFAWFKSGIKYNGNTDRTFTNWNTYVYKVNNAGSQAFLIANGLTIYSVAVEDVNTVVYNPNTSTKWNLSTGLTIPYNDGTLWNASAQNVGNINDAELTYYVDAEAETTTKYAATEKLFFTTGNGTKKNSVVIAANGITLNRTSTNIKIKNLKKGQKLIVDAYGAATERYIEVVSNLTEVTSWIRSTAQTNTTYEAIVTADGDVVFGATTEGNIKIKGIRVLDPLYNLQVYDIDWASLYLPFEAVIPTGAKAYYARSTTSSAVTLTEISTSIPANTGVVVNAEEGICNFEFASSTPAALGHTNLFEGVTSTTPFTDSQIYVLAGSENEKANPVFKLYDSGNSSGVTLAAYKSYLPQANVPNAGNARSITFSFDGDNLTSIKDVKNSFEGIKGQYFDLSGRRVMNPTKGLYIVNGKKVVIK